MYLLKLFHQSDPTQPVAAHLAGAGAIRIGRDPQADWVIPDPECEVSRVHVELSCAPNSLIMTPLGTNGVFDEAGARLAHGIPRPLAPGEAIGFGRYRMTVEAAPLAREGQCRPDRTILAAPFGEDLLVPAVWPGSRVAPQETGDGLLEAFCRGADLEISALSGADPALLLERAGQIYRQTLLGLGDLMQARAGLKADQGLERTTIGAENNNPFKWSPSRRLATDLLLGEIGLMPGPEAIRESVTDLKKHMIATLDGFEAALALVLRTVEPDGIERGAAARRKLLSSTAAGAWNEFRERHAGLTGKDAAGRTAVDRAFADAYRASQKDLARDA
jgi:predicted component of type VI protein secretion system